MKIRKRTRSACRWGSLIAGVVAWAMTAAPAAQAAVNSPAPQLAPAANPCLQASRHLRCPDLVMSAPSHFEVDRFTEPGRVLLRAASSIDNHGAGPLELVGRRVGAGMRVAQALYDRHGRRHVFHTSAHLVFKYVPGARYGGPSIAGFSYWKLRHAAGFALWSVDASFKAQTLVRTGPKLDYCLRDLFRTRPSPRSPRSARYPACSQDPGLQRDVLGTSVGWSDVYPYEYPQQWIDITGLRGLFAYVQIADPSHLLYESNPANNVSETYIELPSGNVVGRRTAVSQP